MQAQATRTIGRNPLISAAVGIGLLAAGLLGIATVTDSVELPTFGNSPASVERQAVSPSLGQRHEFLEANIYHPGFERVTVARPVLETAFLEMNLILPEYRDRVVVRSAEETTFVEMNTILHPDANRSVDIIPNQPS
jgi:hypothetical protein